MTKRHTDEEIEQAAQRYDKLADKFDPAFWLEVLRITADTECHDSIWWRTDSQYAPVTFFVGCNDEFEWATADAEPILPEDLPALRQAIADVEAIEDTYVSEAFTLWVARKRGKRPQGAAYPKTIFVDKRDADKIEQLRQLFDAAGPERETNFWNPKPRPAE